MDFIKWSYKIVEDSPPSEISTWKIWSLKKIIKYIEKKTQPYLKIMEEGNSPLKQLNT
ncbi:MAG: hypothetical protein ACQXXF_01075 [Thermoplasmatota archaeon]